MSGYTQNKSCPDPGVYRGVSFDGYCQWDAVNHSRLQWIDKSPLHCHATPQRDETKAMRFGSLVHAGKLEPDSIEARYAVMPQYELSPENLTGKGERSYKTNTTWCEGKRAIFNEVQNQLGRTIVSQSTYDQYRDCLNAILDNDRATEIINESETEVSIVWQDKATGLSCKARIDIVHPELIGDLKTSRDDGPSPLPFGFEYSLWQYNYYTQAAHYQTGWEVLTGERLPFWFVVVSTTPPIQCIAAPVGEMSLALGRAKNRERLALYAACKESGVWPGYESPELFELPTKYFPDEE